jgi:3-keto-5-aminohexanoate cleavage enzyme
MSRKIIVTVALTGGMHTKAANPHLPEQPDEIAADAYASFNEGAAIAHIHARDPEGNMSGDCAIYTRIHQLIRAKCDIVLQDTTGGGANLTVEQRVQAAVDACPEMASLNMGTLVRTKAKGQYRNTVFRNTTDDIEAFAKAMLDRGIKPEMEVYSHAMFREVENLIEKGLIKPPYVINLVLGMAHQGAEPADAKTLLSLIDFLPPQSMFNVCAVGPAQLPLTTMSALLGGNVRVGMEDNIYYRKGELAPSNAQLVARSVRILRELNLEPASPDEARAMLGLAAVSGDQPRSDHA